MAENATHAPADGDAVARPPVTGTVMHLTPDEHALMIASLRMMRSILGKDEADELRVVDELLEKMVAAHPTSG